ncbi:hypothetical protein AB205_0101040 [Aquarana catesbeiana]|uniref:Peptidase S1 domain-containing protein n=1 Tax=Aquarana catesbeiana TaxID=8400 RepID=A0A2G9RDL5_AQUCT|nr:hypothetical protein AB205_0101040 [Aquarana catesbeiana]
MRPTLCGAEQQPAILPYITACWSSRVIIQRPLKEVTEDSLVVCEVAQRDGAAAANELRYCRDRTLSIRTESSDITVPLSKRAILTKAVKLLPLPTTFEDPKEGSTCETAGWGITEKAHASDILLETNVTILNREQCAKHWKHEVNITENMVCTIVRHGGGDTCDGDSGGPLICNGVLTGLTSFGEFKCGKVNDASVFTRLTKEYIRWINEEITD